jgi:hypothetical protein
MLLLRLRRALGRRLGRVLPEPDRTVLRGWYQGRGHIQPFDLHPILMVGARAAKRLNFGDQVEFTVSERTGHARRVRVYRRPER